MKAVIGGVAFLTLMNISTACGSAEPTATAVPLIVASSTSTQPAITSLLPTPTVGSVPQIGFQSPLPPQTHAPNAEQGNDVAHYTYEIVNTFPHDPNAFTQGLVFDEGVLYEGTGLYGRSSLRRVDLESGAVLTQVLLPDILFGEGITIVEDQIYQLTWREQTGLIYDKTTFALQQQFTYPTEGWGITFDGARLIVSDGTARLSFWDPDSLAELGSVEVHDETGPVVRLNELEYIQGEVFANIWQTDRIARIAPATGKVVGWIDLSGLLPAADRTAATDVLNGIAYLAEDNRLFVTGKLWPKLFEIRLIPEE
ncbi:MAG: glutaminyl-peptide cyclotransferase [Caldilineaceae bacterium]